MSLTWISFILSNLVDDDIDYIYLSLLKVTGLNKIRRGIDNSQTVLGLFIKKMMLPYTLKHVPYIR